MIEYFKVKNFLSYRDETTLSFLASKKDGGSEPNTSFWYKEVDGKRLLKLLIGIGFNGTGKSKMIDALYYFRKLATSKPKDPNTKPDYQPFLLDNESKDQPTEMALSFYVEEKNYLYRFQVSKDNIEEEELRLLEGRGKNIFFRKHNAETGLVEIKFGASCDLSKTAQRELEINTVKNATVLSQFGAMNLDSPLLRQTYDYLKTKIRRFPNNENWLNRMLDSGNKESDLKLKQILLKLFKDLGMNIVDYHIDPTPINIESLQKSGAPEIVIQTLLKEYPTGVIDDKSLRFEHFTKNGNKPLDSTFESDGTLGIIHTLVVFFDIIIKRKFVCIDEINDGIHSAALEFLLNLYLHLADDCQLFVTTHDLTLLNPKKLLLRRDAIREFSKDDDGVTKTDRPDYTHQSTNFYNKYVKTIEESLPISNIADDFEAYKRLLSL